MQLRIAIFASLLSVFFSTVTGKGMAQNNMPNRLDRIWQARKQNCEQSTECRDIPAAESMNCVNRCLSPVCYEKIYASEPLEDGEIDRKRERKFTDCVRQEEKERTVSLIRLFIALLFFLCGILLHL